MCDKNELRGTKLYSTVVCLFEKRQNERERKKRTTRDNGKGKQLDNNGGKKEQIKKSNQRNGWKKKVAVNDGIRKRRKTDLLMAKSCSGMGRRGRDFW